MKLSLGPAFLERFPAATVGVFKASGSVPRSGIATAIHDLQRAALQNLRARAPDLGSLDAQPNILAWRAAYKRFGVKPKRHRPTHEALARRLLQGSPWPRINPIVDFYLTNQVSHLLPHGGYDVSAVTGEVHLAITQGGEPFEPIGGGEELTKAGEVVYRDEAGVLTRRWNYRDCERTKITENTQAFILVVESPSEEISKDAIRAALDGLVDRYTECFRGMHKTAILGSKDGQHSLDV